MRSFVTIYFSPRHRLQNSTHDGEFKGRVGDSRVRLSSNLVNTVPKELLIIDINADYIVG